MADTIFAKIIAKQIPAKIVYEDDQALAFRDIGPKAPVHILIVPKKEIARVSEATAADEPLLGHLLTVAAEIAHREGVDESGYRLVINKGPDAGESVPHLHVHLLGGRPMTWPPG
jgi:histidine triad (HIT) family protein